MSKLFPGLGQIYAGKKVRGYVIAILTLLFYVVGFWLFLGATNNGLAGIVLLFIAAIGLPIANLFDAHRCARRANSPDFERDRKATKDSWLAVFLSQIIPGIGHLYLGQIGLGIIFLVVSVGLASIRAEENLTRLLIVALCSLMLPFFVAYSAYKMAPIQRERSPKLMNLFLLGLLVSMVFSAFFAFGIRTFVGARYIPSSSMSPTLQINDRLVIDKLSYRFQAPQRGDIIVFSPTERLKAENYHGAFIHRIIGLPGDKLEVKNGKVYLNNSPLDEPYADPPEYQWGLVTVPSDSYTVFGDNRNNAYDSHYWGFVPRALIIGKATKIFWPPMRMGAIHG